MVVNYRGGGAEAYLQRAHARVRPSMEQAALLVVPSAFLQDVFARFGLQAAIIPNIIDRARFCPPAVLPAAAPFTLVVTRNLEKLYSVDTAINALAEVLSRGHDVTLRIAGTGPERKPLMAMADKLGVTDRVTFEGRLDRDGIVRLYQAAHAMVNPATVDNMPNSVLEALACGVPVISTNVGGVPYIVRDGETALLVPPEDVSALAEAIIRLKQTPQLAAGLRSNGLAAVQQYTWDKVGPQWLQAYANSGKAAA